MRISDNTRNNLIFAGKVAGGLVVGGGALALAGYGMREAGQSLLQLKESDGTVGQVAAGYFGKFLNDGGDVVFKTGKFTAYTVLVPADILLHRFPKWTITQGIPQLFDFTARFVRDSAHFLVENLVKPALQNLALGLNWCKTRLVEFGNILNEWVITPASEALKKFGVYIFENILDPAFKNVMEAGKWLLEKSTILIVKITEYAIPVFEFIYDTALLVAKFLKEIVTFPHKYIIRPIADCVERAFYFIIEKMVVPFFQAIGDGIVWAAKHFMDLVRLLGEHVIKPIAIMAKNAVVFLVEKMVVPFFQAIGDGIVWAAKHFMDLARLLGEHVIKPFVNMARDAVLSLIENVVVPIFKSVAACTDWVIAKFFLGCHLLRDHIIYPLGRGLYHLGATFVQHVALPAIRGFGTALYETGIFARDRIGYPVMEGLSAVAAAANENILQPVYNTANYVVAETAAATSRAVNGIIEDVSRFFAPAA